MARAPRVAIVGGGIGGLAAALALARRGIEIAVHEQSAQLREIGSDREGNHTESAAAALAAIAPRLCYVLVLSAVT